MAGSCRQARGGRGDEASGGREAGGIGVGGRAAGVGRLGVEKDGDGLANEPQALRTQRARARRAAPIARSHRPPPPSPRTLAAFMAACPRGSPRCHGHPQRWRVRAAAFGWGAVTVHGAASLQTARHPPGNAAGALHAAAAPPGQARCLLSGWQRGRPG